MLNIEYIYTFCLALQQGNFYLICIKMNVYFCYC